MLGLNLMSPGTRRARWPGANLPAGSTQLLVEQNELDGPNWVTEGLTALGPSTGPTGEADGWELICDGNTDPQLLQQLLPPVSLAGRRLLLRTWAKAGDSKGQQPALSWYSYRVLAAPSTGIDQIQISQQSLWEAWVQFEFVAEFHDWPPGDLISWRIDPFDVPGGSNQPAPGSSIYLARPELWLLPS